MKTNLHIGSLTALIVAGALVVGCGRAGAPLKPSEALRQQAKENKQPLPPAPTPNEKNPGKRFVLDGLLE